MKIAILGFASQGQSAYEYWREGNDITICDQSESVELPEGVTSQLGKDYLKDLDRFDLLIRTPFLHPKDILAANPDSPQILDKVWSNTNEFFKVCPTKNTIGVTGTKGKGTTSTIISKMLEASGKKVHLGGNIGIPPLDMLKDNIQPKDWVVLELANFQLIDLKTSPHIAVCLMIEHEHLDWHEDFEEYVTAKQQLFMNQSNQDTAIYYADNEDSLSVADASEGTLIPYFGEPGALVQSGVIRIGEQEICKTSELKLLGKHNWQNVCAAVTAVWQVTQEVEAIRSVLTSFGGLPFRIELRAEKNGINYYNDSYAVAPAATNAAINSVEGMKTIIIGGYERGSDLTELLGNLNEKQQEIRKILLVGASANRVAKALKDGGFSNFVVSEATDMDAIVREATSLSQPGDAVVLSPGFASFDMFKNFEERGNKFNEAVSQL